jgi:DNA-binding NtrC family response regulator
VNCGAIAPNLIESELFGHERGAFTGAVERRRGVFEAATGGTLFLDEIAEMPPDLQVRLLRVLETGVVRRVGAQRAVRVDARIVAATNRDPEVAVREGELREDLLYRLMVFPIRIPSLRERREDIPLLAEHFLGELNRDLRKSLHLTPEAHDELTAYEWPGNVRELRNVLERSCILAQSTIRAEDLPLGRGPRNYHMRPASAVPVGKTIKEMERELILATIEHCGGNRKRAARTLGICVKTLYNRLRVYCEEDGIPSVEELLRHLSHPSEAERNLR